jgi:protein SCO1/2
MKPILKHLLGVAAFLVLAAVAAWLLSQSSITLFSKKLPQYAVVPAFSLIESSGQPFTHKDLAGTVWVADFIYTTCPGPCLSLTSRMHELQDALPASVKFVSISVDPEADTPEVLRGYAQKNGADLSRWRLLTGPKTKVYELIERGFLVTASPNPDIKENPEDKFVHTTKMVLVDQRGAIRGYYDGLSDSGLAELKRDVKHLLRDSR